MPTLSRTCSAVAVLLFILVCGVTTASAQDRDIVEVQQLPNQGNIAVHVFTANGGTEAQAGRMAMDRACEVARERGYPYLGVGSYESASESTRVQTKERGVRYHGGTDGRPVITTPTPAEHGTATYGRALLMVTMMSAATVDMLEGAMDMIEVEGCTIYSRRNPR